MYFSHPHRSMKCIRHGCHLVDVTERLLSSQYSLNHSSQIRVISNIVNVVLILLTS